MLFIPVAIPGAGKSTWGKAIGAHVISTDAIREELTNDANDQSQNDRVFEIFHRRLRDSLTMGWSPYADATNLDAASRADLRRIAADFIDVPTHLVLFRNVEQAIIRNVNRDRVVPDHVMLRMIEKYERALLDIEQEEYTYVTEVSSVR